MQLLISQFIYLFVGQGHCWPYWNSGRTILFVTNHWACNRWWRGGRNSVGNRLIFSVIFKVLLVFNPIILLHCTCEDIVCPNPTIVRCKLTCIHSCFYSICINNFTYNLFFNYSFSIFIQGELSFFFLWFFVTFWLHILQVPNVIQAHFSDIVEAEKHPVIILSR